MTHAALPLMEEDDALKLLRQCQDCGATCCTYITVALDDPGDDLDEWESIRWYLTRENTKVYVDEDGDWQLQIGERCRFLQDDMTCGNYDNRPQVCADHDPSDCEYWGDPEEEYQQVWNSFEAFDAYYQNEVKPKLLAKKEREAKKRSARARKAAKARWAKSGKRANGAHVRRS